MDHSFRVYDQNEILDNLKYAHGKFAFDFHKNRIFGNVIATSLRFSKKNVHNSSYIELTNFILGSNIQHHKVI